MRVVAAVPACALVTGAAAGLSLAEPHLFVTAVALSAALVAAYGGWLARRPLAVGAGVAAAFFVGGTALGASAWQRAWRPPLRVAFERAVDERGEAFFVLEGTLRADAAPTSSGVSLSLDVDRASRERDSSTERDAPMVREGSIAREGFRQASASGGAMLTVAGDIARDRMDTWRAGRRIRLPATLRRSSVYLDPAVPDNERALARRGTTLVGTVKSGALVEVLARGTTIDEALAATRAFARQAIANAVGRLDPQAAAVVAAIVIGDRAGLDPDVQRKLQDAGTYHVIAISGGNIAILAGLLLGAFRIAGWLGRPAMVAAIGLLAAYARLVGGGASVDRATLMAALYLAGRAVDHRTAPLNTVAVAAALLAAVDPLAVVDPAFVLTFGATVAILLVATGASSAGLGIHQTREATKHASWLIRRALGVALSMFAASLATEAMLFPVGALVFSRITFAGLALNFLAIPLMAVAQVAGMLLVPLAIVSRRAAAGAGWFAFFGAAGLVRSADLVRLAPSIAYRIAPPPVAVVATYYVCGGVAWWMRRRPIPSAAASLIAAAAAIWILVDPLGIAAARGDGRLRVTFIDVGQGDSAFVRFPSGSTLVVDAGGLSFSTAFDIGDRVVAPVIRAAGVYRLDAIALTHGDPDHIGGAPSLVREFRPHEVWEGIPVPRSDPLTRLRVAAQAGGGRWANVYAGDHALVDGVDVIARHPAPADWERQKVRNDDSLVLELRWRDVSVVLTGDVGRRVEDAIAGRLPPAVLRVVKVPHHGSLTSSSAAFVDAVRPQVAVVSVGRGNHYGHPAAEVLQRYGSVGAAIFRTDQDGAVSVETDGHSMSVTTFTGRRLSLTANASTKAQRLEEGAGSHALDSKPKPRSQPVAGSSSSATPPRAPRAPSAPSFAPTARSRAPSG